VLGEFDIGSWSEEKTGYSVMRVRRSDLQDVLLDAVREEGIQVHYSRQVVRIEEKDDGGIAATFSDGAIETADLLLGCDGIHSTVRSLYVDPEATPEYSGISVIYSFLPESDLPSTTSSTAEFTGTLTADGLFALGPCTASSPKVLFWFFSHEVPIPASGNTRDGWEEHGRLEVERFKTNLLDVLRDVQGEWGILVKSVVKETRTVKFYPVFKLPFGGKWSRGRSLLLGDAAHAMQPHAIQGVSMALEDAFLLSRLLQKSSSSTSSVLSDVFEKFDGIRRPRIEKFARIAGQNATHRRTGPWGLWFKELGLSTMLWLFWITGFMKWRFFQGDLIYDVDEVPI
jgi:2-polyprenyl-6-methoxyphenol hydroxylase-like FAD-dependent oxidoreductase